MCVCVCVCVQGCSQDLEEAEAEYNTVVRAKKI